MAHCRDIMHTSNPCKDYAFLWTVENFHLLSPLEVRGTAFSPIPGCLKKFCFELAFTQASSCGYLDFKVIDLNPNKSDRHITVHGKVAIKNSKELLCNFVTLLIQEIQPITTLYSFDRNSFGKRNTGGAYPLIPTYFPMFGLADGKIVLEGTLTFSSYSIKPSNYSLLDRNCEEVTQDLKTMFENGLASDVTFSIGGQLVRAHKAILVARSEVFAKMFQHDMLENKTNTVTIKDVDYGTFNRFLVYLYTGVLDLAEGDCPTAMRSLYSVAQKYQVKGLSKICVARFSMDLSVESVCADLVLADLHGDEELKSIVKIFLRENIFSVVGTLAWTEIVSTKPALAQEVLDFVKPAIK